MFNLELYAWPTRHALEHIWVRWNCVRLRLCMRPVRAMGPMATIKTDCNYSLYPFDAGGCWWRRGKAVAGRRVCLPFAVVFLFPSHQSFCVSVYLCRRNMSFNDFPCLYVHIWESMCVCVWMYVCACDRDRNRQPRNQRGREVERNLFYCLVLFIYFILNCHTPSSHCQCVLRGRLYDITRGAEQSSIARGTLKGAVWRRWSLVGDPSQSFSDESESACSSPESSPPVAGRKRFLKCSYNTLSQQAPHTHTHIHTLSLFLWLIWISTCW